MIVPKYQWLIEAQTPKCGKRCDMLYIPNDIEPKFQVKFDPTVLVDEDFDGDDINYPLDGDTYVFDISGTPLAKDYVNSYSFEYGGQFYTYIFAYDDSIVGFYTLTQYGDFYLVKMSGGLHKNEYRNAVNEYMADYGVSASHDGTDMTVTGLPTGTQIDIAINGHWPTVSGITGVATWGLNNFLPVNDKVCFFQLSGLDIIGNTSTPSIYKEVVITPGARVIATVQFTNSFDFDVDLDFTVRDDSFNEIEVITKTALQGTNTLQFCFLASETPPTYYILEFLLSDPSVYESSIVNQTVGFCYTNVKIEEIGSVASIGYTDCNGVEHELEIDEWIWDYQCGYNYLIQITGYLPNDFSLSITGSDDDTFESINYRKIDVSACPNNLLALTWADDCMFGDLDYANLPFTNSILLRGYWQKTSGVTKERITTTNTDGSISTVFDHSLSKIEVSIGNYQIPVHDTLERAFIHKTLTVDGESYYIDEGASYAISGIGNTFYTARIDLVNNPLIKSMCCC